MDLAYWTQQAYQSQSRIRRKRKPVKQTFVIFKRDLPELKRKIGRRLAAMINVEQEITLPNDRW